MSAPTLPRGGNRPPRETVKITPAMVDAGVMALFAYDNDEMFTPPEERVIAIFRAMISAKSRALDDGKAQS